MSQLFTNNATSGLASDITSFATSIQLPSGKGALFANPSSPDYQLITLEDSAGAYEIASITSRSGDTLTVTRGMEGTTGIAWSSADCLIEARLTSGSLSMLPKISATNSLSILGSAGGINSVSIGANAISSGNNSVSVGSSASTGASIGAIAVGNSTTSSSNNSISFGNTVSVSGAGSMAIGKGITLSGTDTVSIGRDLTSSNNQCVYIGNPTVALQGLSSDRSICIGYSFNMSGTMADSILIGSNISSTGGTVGTVVIGGSATSTSGGAIVIGYQAASSGTTGVAIGTSSGRSSLGGTLFGGSTGVAIGTISRGLGVAIGYNSVSTTVTSVSIGPNTQASTGATAIGESAIAFGTSSIAIGKSASASSQSNTVVGANSVGVGNYVTVVGASASATAEGAIAIGAGASSNMQYGVSISGTSYITNSDNAQSTSAFGKRTGYLSLISIPTTSSAIFNTVNSDLFTPEDMTSYTSTLFICEKISFIIVSGSVTTAPTLTLSGNLANKVFTPSNLNTETASDSGNTPIVISNGSGTLSLKVTSAATGTFSARVVVYGYFLGV